MSTILKKLFTKTQEEPSNECKKQKVRIEFDIEEHDYTVRNVEGETFDSYAYTEYCGVDNLEIYVDEVKLSDEIVHDLNERYTDYKKEILNWDDEVDDVASFGYFEGTLHRLYEFDTESFDFNKLEFLWNCYDVTFEEADYCVEEHRLTVLYDGVELENLMDDSCVDAEWEEVWSRDDKKKTYIIPDWIAEWEEVWPRDDKEDEDCCDDENEESEESKDSGVIKASKVFGILAYTAASLDDEVTEEEIKAIRGIANALKLDVDMVRQSVMLEKMGIRSYDSQSKLAASVPEEYHDKLFQGIIMVLIADFKIKQVELSFLSGLRDVWELSDEYADNVLNFHVQRLIDSNPDREFEIEEDEEVNDETGDVEEMLNEKYDNVFKDGDIFCVNLNDKYGIVDTEGNELIPPRYDWMGDEFVEDVIIVGYYGGGIGYVNNEGVEIVAPKYSQARNFHNGFAAVCHGDKWGFIDKTGKEVVPAVYDDVNNFEDGKAEVTLNGETFFVDTQGKRIGAAGNSCTSNDDKIPEDTDVIWNAVINGLPEEIKANVSAPAGRAYFFIKSKNKPNDVDDFKFVVQYYIKTAIASVSVETLNGGEVGKKAIQKYIDSKSDNSYIKDIRPQQGTKNKNKWAWTVSEPASGKSFTELVKWYVDTISHFYGFFETI